MNYNLKCLTEASYKLEYIKHYKCSKFTMDDVLQMWSSSYSPNTGFIVFIASYKMYSWCHFAIVCGFNKGVELVKLAFKMLHTYH